MTCRAIAPPPPVESPGIVELPDDTHPVAVSVKLDDPGETRITRGLLAWHLKPEGDPDKFEDYLQRRLYVLADSESPASHGDVRQERILTQWLAPEAAPTAAGIISRRVSRLKNGAREVAFALELKDSGVQLGDLVRITSTSMEDVHGEPIDRRLLFVIKRKPGKGNRIDYAALDLSFLPRYAFWVDDDWPDYPDASTIQRQTGGFFGDESNRVGPEKEDGYHVS